MDPESPLEIGSQAADDDFTVSQDGNAENHDLESDSLRGFATQLPLADIVKPKNHIERQTSHVNVLLDQLAGPDVTPASKRPTEDLKANAPNLPDPCGEPSSSFDLSQRPIAAPAGTPPTAVRHMPTPKQTKGMNLHSIAPSSIEKVHEATLSTSMPVAVIEVLRGWRQDCYDGRHIPRRLQIISKDQAKILDSKESWQPALVGHPQRPGTIPISLLNELSRIADHDASFVSPNHAHAVDVDVDEKSDGHQCGPLLEQPEDKEVEEQKQNDPNGNLISSDQESDEESWTPTPPRPSRTHRELPPDSPTSPVSVRENKTRRGDIHADTKELNPSQSGTSGGAVIHHMSSASVTHGQKSVEAGDQSQSIESGGQSVVNSQALVSGRRFESAPVSPKELQNSSGSLQRTIQVKRTPFHIKGHSLSSPLPDSSAHLVPATFDENNRRTHQAKDKVIGMSNKAKEKDKGIVESGYVESFEADSSEDDLVAQRSQTLNEDSHLTSSSANYRLETMNPSGALVQSADNNMQRVGNPQKRKLDVHLPAQNKRSKSSSSQQGQRGGYEQVSEYNVVDTDRRQYRRQYLNQIGHKRKESLDVPSQRTASVQEAETAMTQAKTSSKQSHQSSETHGLQTPDTTRSTHLPLKRSEIVNRSFRSPSISATISKVATPDLFDMFKTTYSAYNGQRTHFVAACQLLRRLQLQGKSTHPSLWDDFVFRHFHEYRQYLLEILENCGSAVPYEQFYDEFVQQPTYLGQLIKASELVEFLDGPKTEPSISALIETNSASGQRLKTDSVGHPMGLSASNGLSKTDHAYDRQALPNGHSQQVPLTVPNQVLSTDKTTRASKKTTSPSQSQGPSTSVSLWLERVAGNESPLLGTPEVMQPKDTDIPKLVLDQDTSVPLEPTRTSPKPKKRRSLPWTSASTNSMPSKPTTVQKPPRSNVNQQQETQVRDSEVTKLSKRRKSSQQPPSQQQTQAGKAQRETAFQRWTRLYSNLSSEKEATRELEARPNYMLDITAWRG